ncbi:hypothetical protein DJFAAGMI_01263 [Comamonas sp. PE63]|uniref:Tip attachment protein J HDII-ins2 domain-containing protein n=1 Tax=Comamonas brasiliensis TaxID=1812482 RepID=A0ABS5LQQ0_9BURK|nr:host specificity factor TipJ family phage tail protein [Comamonas sp. PE63]MBS3018531.1 hypothetical protein [Comamonas sp. PE63]
MEVSHAESAAAVDGLPADVLDRAGRLVVAPHALTVDGLRNVPADLQPGESLAAFLARHVPGIESGAWTVCISGHEVPRHMWARTFPRHGQLIACRAMPQRAALQLVALAALSYFTLGGGAGWIGTTFGAGAGVSGAIGLGMFVAGSVLVNKVLAPKMAAAQTLAQKQIYSLSDQRNTARPYEPIPVLWGEMRVTPDLASKSYAWYEGDDQYLSTILLGGINVHSAADLAIGETLITSYADVSVYYNGFAGMPSQEVPLYSNVDAVAGAEFVNGGDWITRTGSAGAAALQLDIEGQLYDVDNKGRIRPNSVELTIEARVVGSAGWLTLSRSTLTHASTDVLRRTFSFDVAPGQYEVRARLGVPRWHEGGTADACKFTWVSLKSVQADTTDYRQWGRIGIRIRASGQISGSLDTVRVTYRARPLPIWTGTQWATAATRAEGLSNPGAILLQTLRGVWVTDAQGQRVLQFGFGLSDEQIDIEGLKAFMLHCAARGYTYDRWVTASMSLGAFCQEVALAGMGEFTWTDGSRPTAVFVGRGQPTGAVVNMANMLKGGFSVDYALSQAADGIEYQWLSRETWEMTTLRVMAPGVTTMLSPARVTGEGITSEQHAAVMARYHLAQSLYQYKTVHFTADIEHLDYRRLSVLSVSHDLTQWGFGGRVMAARRTGAQVQLTLDEPVPPLATPYIGLRVPGARDYRVWAVQPLQAESDVITLAGEWPGDLALPGEGADNLAHDTLWCYDFKATPGYRVRVTGIDPESDLKGARVTAVPEGPEFWDYVLNGHYVPAPGQSTIAQLVRPAVKNLRVAEKVNLQGNTQWYELSCVWDVEGDCDHAQVWAGRDGSELRLVDGNAQSARSTFRIDGAGEWLIDVRPFNASGQAGQSATLLYITTMTQLPPRNPGSFTVQQVEGGLRRFAWEYAGERPAAFAGVQIRYVPGDVPLSVANWEAMQPLGSADDVYAAQFVTTQPDAGQWTFGLRAIDTAGQLANGVMRFAAVLETVFDNVVSPDLTPPPAPSGLEVSVSLANILLAWDAPEYLAGHGHQFTRVYAAQVTAEQPAPGRTSAEVAAEIVGSVGAIARALGTSWRLWFVNVSNDAVESADAGPVTVTVGKIGSTDLGPLIVGAGHLANGAVSAAKLAAQAVEASKFANGIEPVTNSSAATLPSVKSTTVITWQGKLYRWDGSKYTAEVRVGDMVGQIAATQIADSAITTPKLAANAVNAAKIAANAVTANAISANAITAGKIAAGAVNTRELAANAVTASKLVVTATDTVNLDPFFEDAALWAAPNWSRKPGSIGSPGPYVLSSSVNQSNIFTGTRTPIDVSRTYLFETWFVALGAHSNKAFASIRFFDVNGAVLANTDAPATGWPGTNSSSGNYYFPGVGTVTAQQWTRYTLTVGPNGVAKFPPKAAFFIVGAYLNYSGAAPVVESQWGGLRVTEMARGELIVDGAITATKLSANAIAVGSAAIQDGAIVNAMIGNLSADKINAGTLNAARIGAGTISANHLASNSVAAVKIAANAVTADKLAANAVTATKIAAGAITVDKLAAGSVTADKLTVGTGGNLCPDSTFTPGLAFWERESHLRSGAWGVNLNVDYSVNGSPTLFIEDSAAIGGTGYMGVISGVVSVIPGERYEVSAYMSSHRSTAEIIMLFQDTTGGWGAAYVPGVGIDEADGWKMLSRYKRVGGFVTVPAGMTRMKMILRKYATQSGSSSYLFATRPFIGLARPNQTELSPWTPSGSTQLLPDGITTPSIAALAGKFGDIEIRPTAGASGCIRVYDANGVMRVRLGVW